MISQFQKLLSVPAPAYNFQQLTRNHHQWGILDYRRVNLPPKFKV